MTVSESPRFSHPVIIGDIHPAGQEDRPLLPQSCHWRQIVKGRSTRVVRAAGETLAVCQSFFIM